MDAGDRKPGGEGGIRTRPFFEPSCYQGDGENPYKHSHSNTISFPSYLSNVARFNCISVFLKLMELMHSSLVSAETSCCRCCCGRPKSLPRT